MATPPLAFSNGSLCVCACGRCAARGGRLCAGATRRGAGVRPDYLTGCYAVAMPQCAARRQGGQARRCAARQARVARVRAAASARYRHCLNRTRHYLQSHSPFSRSQPQCDRNRLDTIACASLQLRVSAVGRRRRAGAGGGDRARGGALDRGAGGGGRRGARRRARGAARRRGVARHRAPLAARAQRGAAAGADGAAQVGAQAPERAGGAAAARRRHLVRAPCACSRCRFVRRD